MGNTPSVEAPKKRSRATQKLSKPRIGNPATAGLLNPNGITDIVRQPPSTTSRCFSLPHSPTSISSPHHLKAESTGEDGLTAPCGASSPRLLSQPDPQGVSHRGAQSFGEVLSLNCDPRITTADPVYIGADEDYEQAQLGLAANASRSSMNYDLYPLEARRLLHLVEEPPFEDQSIASENLIHIALPRRRSYTTPYHPVHSDVGTLLPRTNSDASLYAPMRRGSLRTPGVATRPSPADLILPPDTQTSNIIFPTLLHSSSSEPKQPGFLSSPYSPLDPDPMSRAHTPCETEYKQTGAFKHGTLRITNGSPVSTPAQEISDNGRCFDSQSRENQGMKPDGSQCLVAPRCATVSSTTSATNTAAEADEREAAMRLLPELSLSMSPFSISGVGSGPSELQITSKHTAIEDQLFEDSSPEYGTEVSNIRFDHDAEPPFCSPCALEDGRPKKFSRSDSGIVASPSPNAPHTSLSKADSGYSSNTSIRSVSSKHNRQKELHGEPPPPVPEKDHTEGPKLATSTPNGPRTLAREDELVPKRASIGAAPELAYHSTFCQTNSSTAASTQSVRNKRKPGRLQRLLSGSRTPLTARVTHGLEIEACMPPIPQATHEKLHEHPQFSPNSFDDYAENADTMKGNFKLGVACKMSVPQGRDLGSRGSQHNNYNTRKNQDKTRGIRPSFNIHSISSTLTRAASSVISRKYILKKPTPNQPASGEEDSAYQFLGFPETATQHPMGGRDRYRPTRTASHPNPRPVSVGGPDSRTRLNTCHNSLVNEGGQYAIAFRNPPFSSQYIASGIPAVGMRTQSSGPLRVPPPIRPRSTPPTRSGVPTLSHKSSREGVQSYPPYSNPAYYDSVISSRRSSQDSFYAYSAGQIQPFLNQPPRTSSGISTMNPSGIQPRSRGYRGLSSFPNSKYGSAPSQDPLFDHSRRSSLVSQTSQRSALGDGQLRSHYLPYDNPTLRQRSSYDGYLLEPWHGHNQDIGQYPPLPRAQLHQSLHHQQQARYTSRGHLRHQSLDQYRGPAPYRVLHSYNSPAYRGVPIWSS